MSLKFENNGHSRTFICQSWADFNFSIVRDRQSMQFPSIVWYEQKLCGLRTAVGYEVFKVFTYPSKFAKSLGLPSQQYDLGERSDRTAWELHNMNLLNSLHQFWWTRELQDTIQALFYEFWLSDSYKGAFSTQLLNSFWQSLCHLIRRWTHCGLKAPRNMRVGVNLRRIIM